MNTAKAAIVRIMSHDCNHVLPDATDAFVAVRGALSPMAALVEGVLGPYCGTCWAFGETVQWIEDPYMSEIHGDRTRQWMCANCAHESAMDI